VDGRRVSIGVVAVGRRVEAGGGGEGGGEGGDHQEAEASKRVQEAAWPCRRRHLVDVLAAELQLPSQMGATYNDGSTGWTN